MADKKQQEEVVEQVEETKAEEPQKSSSLQEDGTYKVDLTQPVETQDEEADDNVTKVDMTKPVEETTEEKVEEPQQEGETQEQAETEQPVLEEITETEEQVEVKEEQKEEVNEPELNTVEEEVEETKENPGMELPENIQKVVDFMNETGGTLEDYVRLNADYSNVDNEALLREYYKQTKPHLNSDEVNFMLEDKFSYDEEVDEARDVKRKKLAYKEAVAEAKQHLELMKDKYYTELKLGSKLPPEQQKAVEFFDRYNKEQDQVKELSVKQQQHFNKETNKVFNESFKGFDFQVGNKKYRYNVKDVQQTKDNQSDVLKVFSEYVDNNNMLTNAAGYHKSLFAARNADALAKHFYEQGKADAVREMTSEAKNINLDRKTSDGMVETGKQKVRVISGDNSSSPRFRLKNY